MIHGLATNVPVYFFAGIHESSGRASKRNWRCLPKQFPDLDYGCLQPFFHDAGGGKSNLRLLGNQKGWKLEVLDLDVTDEASVNDAVQQALDRAGRIDVVINNAGIGTLGITEAYTVEQYQVVLDVTYCGSCGSTVPCCLAMRRQRSGLLIHVSIRATSSRLRIKGSRVPSAGRECPAAEMHAAKSSHRRTASHKRSGYSLTTPAFFLNQEQLVLTNVLGSELIRRAMKMLGECGDVLEVQSNASGGVIAPLELIQHALAKLGHHNAS